MWWEYKCIGVRSRSGYGQTVDGVGLWMCRWEVGWGWGAALGCVVCWSLEDAIR